MADQQVMTLDNPAGLLLTPEILKKIGVSTGDQIEISVSERTLTVRSLTEVETEIVTATRPTTDETTVTIRELINQTLDISKIEEAVGIEVTLADGQTLRLHSADDLQLDDVVRRADVRSIKVKQSAHASGRTMDEMMESIMDRHDNLFRRLAEGVK